MYDVSGACKAELEELMERMAIPPAEWWPKVPEAFESALSQPVKVQSRLDATLVALLMRSHLGSLRTRCYHLLAERSLSFPVAAGCERISKRYPEAAWLLKLAVSGQQPHAKLYLDRKLTLQELEPVAQDLSLPAGAVIGAAEALIEATGAPALRCLSVAAGDPVRLELYASRQGGLDGSLSSLDAVAHAARMTYDASFEALRDVHAELSVGGRQRFSLGVDGRGVRVGFKVAYADMSARALSDALQVLPPAPAIAERRLKVASEFFGVAALDHLSVRLKEACPIHLTAYFNRQWAAAA